MERDYNALSKKYADAEVKVRLLSRENARWLERIKELEYRLERISIVARGVESTSASDEERFLVLWRTVCLQRSELEHERDKLRETLREYTNPVKEQT